MLNNKILIITLLFLATTSILNAQNKVLLEQNTVKMPEKLNEVCDAEINKAGKLNNLMDYAYQFFRKNHLRNYDGFELYVREYPLRDKYKLNWDYIKLLGKNFFKNPAQVAAVYNLSFPLIKEAFKEMTIAEQTALFKMIEEALVYTENFDLEKETKDLEDITKKRKAFQKEKGSVQAFIYRRIANNEMSKKEGIYWLNKIKKDLSKVKKKREKGLEKYYLQSFNRDLSDILVFGKVYGTDERFLFEKKEDKWQKVQHNGKEISGISLHGQKLLGGVAVISKDANGSFQLFFRKNRVAFQSFQLSYGYISQSYEGKAIRFGNTDICAINDDGELECRPITEEEKSTYVHLFEYKSGKKDLFYSPYKYDLKQIKNPRFVATHSNGSIWVFDGQQQAHAVIGKKLTTFELPEKIKSATAHGYGCMLYTEQGKQYIISERLKNKTAIPIQSKIDLADIRLDEIRDENKAKKSFLIVTTKEKLVGCWDRMGKEILQPNFKKIRIVNYGKHMVVSDKEGLMGVVNNKGEVLIPNKYTRITNDYKSKLFIIENTKGVGLANEEGKVVIEPTYTKIYPKKIGGGAAYLFEAVDNNNSKHLYDANGKEVLADYKKIQALEDQGKLYYLVEREGNSKLLDATLKKRINLSDYKSFRQIKSLGRTYFGVITKDDLRGVIALDGTVLIKPVYKYLSLLYKTSNFIFSNQKVNKIEFSDFSNIAGIELLPRGLFDIVEEKGATFGIININGKVLHPAKFTAIKGILNDFMLAGTFMATKNNGTAQKFALFNAEAKALTDYKFVYIDNRIQKNIIITLDPNSFEEIERVVEKKLPPAFCLYRWNDAFAINTEKGIGIFDKMGKEIIAPSQWGYTEMTSFINGNFIGKKGGLMGMMTDKNKVVIPFKYKNIKPLYSDSPSNPSFIAVGNEVNGKLQYALFDENGKVITDFIFDDILEIEEELDYDTFEVKEFKHITVIKAGKKVKLDAKGKLIK